MTRKRILEVGGVRSVVLETPISGPEECPLCGNPTLVVVVQDSSIDGEPRMVPLGKRCMFCVYTTAITPEDAVVMSGDIRVPHDLYSQAAEIVGQLVSNDEQQEEQTNEGLPIQGGSGDEGEAGRSSEDAVSSPDNGRKRRVSPKDKKAD